MSSENSEQARVTVTGLSGIGTPIVTSSGPPPVRPRWLWPKRIPLGYLTLLAGEPQVGKSYLTLDIATRVSKGGPWPDESAHEQAAGANGLGPGSVLLISIEGSWRNTIRPQLEALARI